MKTLDAAGFTQLCKFITPEQRVWVAYSGGMDSHVLLHLAAQNLKNVAAIHVNDQLSPYALQWQHHCQKICIALNIAFECVTVNVAINPGDSPENICRIARRRAWHSVLQANDILLVAHHAQDQAETILYRLFRGTGPQGLRGMQAYSAFGNAHIFRPLLNISKNSINKYAEKHKLKWIDDVSNLDVSFDRNYIRHQIMPLITQRWPAVTNNINRAGRLCGQLLNSVQPLVLDMLQKIRSGKQLDLQQWQLLPQLWQMETLRAWFAEHDLVPSYATLQIIIQQVIKSRADAQPEYKIANKIVRRSKNKLYILDNVKVMPQSFCMNWDLQRPLKLPNGNTLTLEHVSNNPLFIDKLQQFEITVQLGSVGIKAKKIFQQFNIPPWQRHEYPLIFADDRLVCVVGLWCSSRI